MLYFTILTAFLILHSTANHIITKRQDDGLENFVLNSFYNFGEFLATGAYDLRLPSIDPVQVRRRFPMETITNSTQLTGSASQMTLTGLSNMSITHIDMSLPDMKLIINFTIPKLMIAGEYNAKGIIYQVFPLNGNGDFVIEAENVTAATSTDMKMNPEEKNLEVEKFNVDFSAGFLRQSFESMLGGGHVGTLINYFGRKLGESVFETLHPFLTRTFGEAVRRKLVQVLRKIRIPQELRKRAMIELNEDEKFNVYFDQVVGNFKKLLNERGPEPLPLPNVDKIFQNGSIAGLGSLERHSDAFISSKEDKLLINVTLMLRNVSIMYHWTLRFLPEHDGKIEVKVNSVLISLKIEVDLSSRDIGFRVKQLKIVDIRRINANLKGLGPFNSLFSTTLNDAVRMFAKTFAYLIENAVKVILESALNQFVQNNSSNK